MERKKLLIVVVVYNELAAHATSVQRLLSGAFELALYDNSTKAELREANERFAQEHAFITYYTQHQNVGLSKAYNEVIKANASKYEWYLTLDQDSELSEAFVDFLRTFDAQEALIMPCVYTSEQLLSPSGVVLDFTASKEVVVPSQQVAAITGINSGLLINAKVFEAGIAYEERLFLDLVDHQFIKDVKKQFTSIRVVDYPLYQAFSSEQYDLAAEQARFAIFKKDLKIFYEDQPMKYYFTVVKRLLKLSLKYKRIVWK